MSLHGNPFRTYECPEWFKDAKFGIYTHWGPYSVPSWENEWYPRLMYSQDDERRGSKFYDYHKADLGRCVGIRL